MTLFERLQSDGTGTWQGVTLAPEPEPERRSIIGEQLWWPPGPAGGVVVTEETALQLAPLLAVANVLATDIATLPLKVYRRQPDGSRAEGRSHPNARLLSRSPNGETTPVRWRKALVLHALLYGTGYAEIQRLGKGTPHKLHLLDPGTTRPERRDGVRGDEMPAGPLRYRLGNGKLLEATNVLQVAGLSFDGLTGYNFVRLLRQSIGLALGAEGNAAEYFQNGSEPGGVLEIPALTPEATTRLRGEWEAKHSGAGNRNRVAVLEQGTTWKKTATDPEKSQLLETRKFQVLDVIRPSRVPPHKAGDFSMSHLANIEASNLDYLMTALIGWLEEIEQEFSFKLFTEAEWDDGWYVEHDVNALLRGDIKSRFESYASALDRGWLNRDEVRRRENLNPIGAGGGGEQYLVQAQMTPLDKAGIAFGGEGVTTTADDPRRDTVDPAADAGPPAEDVQAAALNGAQIASLLEIVNAVASGTLPADTGAALIAASFPTLTAGQIGAMLAPLDGFEPATPPAAPNPFAPSPPPDPDPEPEPEPEPSDDGPEQDRRD